ncbi:beta-ketoacyl synthase chain length factor [Cricetibacter osteomyelitidis]|uniref:beta-ketoacyl synthase chain length factor n=1 Tax=Cricetibacter osteomyelitidis TaxID=1521931 RepID=UPI00104AAFE1|nr:beta-ketoacyl synthase chain length factor [Cricetibacter osteomyelitidis]
MQFSLSIAQYKTVSPLLHNQADWLTWANGRLLMEFEQKPLDLSFLPVMQRRRLSALPRLVFVAAWEIMQDKQCPVVYLSRDGEFSRSFSLLKELGSGEQLSPTSFGLSVHNSVVGQWSMIRKDTSEMTALAAREDGLETAFLEAYLLLQSGHDEVLVIITDESLCEDNPVGENYLEKFAYAAAFLVTKGNELTLRLTPHRAKPYTTDYSANLENLRNLILTKPQWQHHLIHQNKSWHWTYNK